jgi:hypothetical protein
MAVAHPSATSGLTAPSPVTTPSRTKNRRRRPASYWLAIIAASATIALTSVTFWLSYEALHDLAAGHHLIGARAWAWPATIDAFIVVGEVLILRASLLRRIDWLAVVLVALGSIGSIILNIVSVGAHVDGTTRVVAAVPPVAALLAFTALMRQLYRALAADQEETDPSPEEYELARAEALAAVAARMPAAPVAPVMTPPLPPMPAAPPVLPPAAPQPTAQQPPAPEQPPAGPPPIAYKYAACQAIRPLYDGGFRPGTASMRAALTAAGYSGPSSDGYIRGTLRAEVEQHEPHLTTLPAEPVQLFAATP